MAGPSFNQGMQMRGEQRMLLQPRLLQSIEVLQLPTLDLESWLQETAAGNEALVVEGPQGPEQSERRGSWADADAHDEMLRNQPGPGPSLVERVEQELAGAQLTPPIDEWVRLLVGALSPEGYLSASDEDLLALAAEQGLAGGRAELALSIATLQAFEPRGIGARNAIDALLLQLDPGDPNYQDLCVLLEEFVEELAKNKIPAVARAMGLEVEDVNHLLGLLSELNPRPASALVDRSAPVIVPDVMVTWTGSGYEVSVESAALPAVSIDEEVQALARDRTQERGVRDYLRGKVDQARWIVDAVRQRGETLLRVAQAVFVHQRAFLDEGPGNIRPLQMIDVAEALGMHVSTVSRAVAGKYAQTPHGIFPLRPFFQVAADEGVSRDEVADDVREIIAAENPAQPLSDDEIVAALQARGRQVARRTVAKYRKELGLPSSYRRRKFG